MTEELRIARKFGEHVFSADASMSFKSADSYDHLKTI